MIVPRFPPSEAIHRPAGARPEYRALRVGKATVTDSGERFRGVWRLPSLPVISVGLRLGAGRESPDYKLLQQADRQALPCADQEAGKHQ